MDKENMALLSFQFSRQDDLGSLAIRTFEHGGEWSHVDAIMSDGSLLGARNDVVDGIPAGVRIRPSNYSNFAAYKRVHLEVTQAVADAYQAFLSTQIGKPYDQSAILAFIFNRDWREHDSWFCSELVAGALESAQALPHKLAATANKITPGDLFLVLSALTDVWGSGDA